MFKKKVSEPAASTVYVPDAPKVEPIVTPSEISSQPAPAGRRCTIVAQNTSFTGNIVTEGDIQVYGKVLGNINLDDGILYVMRDGLIEGEITAPGVVINGRVLGICTGETVEIQEHGELEGICRSGAFSIRPGGSFIGQSERPAVVQKTQEPERVVKINKKNQNEKTADESTVIALAHGE